MEGEDKRIIKSVSETISKMTEFEKGYILGTAESKMQKKQKNDQQDKSKKTG